LKRRDSDKEIKGFFLDFFGPIWPGLGKFGIGLGKTKVAARLGERRRSSGRGARASVRGYGTTPRFRI
jgi:hypothetical protein